MTLSGIAGSYTDCPPDVRHYSGTRADPQARPRRVTPDPRSRTHETRSTGASAFPITAAQFAAGLACPACLALHPRSVRASTPQSRGCQRPPLFAATSLRPTRAVSARLVQQVNLPLGAIRMQLARSVGRIHADGRRPACWPSSWPTRLLPPKPAAETLACTLPRSVANVTARHHRDLSCWLRHPARSPLVASQHPLAEQGSLCDHIQMSCSHCHTSVRRRLRPRSEYATRAKH